MAITPIKRNNISDLVFEQIKENILDGEWVPGTKIPSESELCQMFSVSRVPIREALQRLGAIGLVETRQGEGTYVSHVNPGTFMNSLIPMLTPNKKNMMDILKYREIVEPKSASLAALNANNEDIARMEATLAKMIEINEVSIEFSVADFGFHLDVARATQNTLIFGAFNVINDIAISYYEKINMIMGIERAIKYHTLILDAIKNKDAEMAMKWMEEHIGTTVNDISSFYED